MGLICCKYTTEKMDYLRNFVEEYHHGKEERLLFNQMKAKLGMTGEQLITHGMLVESKGVGNKVCGLYMHLLQHCLQELQLF